MAPTTMASAATGRVGRGRAGAVFDAGDRVSRRMCRVQDAETRRGIPLSLFVTLDNPSAWEGGEARWISAFAAKRSFRFSKCHRRGRAPRQPGFAAR